MNTVCRLDVEIELNVLIEWHTRDFNFVLFIYVFFSFHFFQGSYIKENITVRISYSNNIWTIYQSRTQMATRPKYRRKRAIIPFSKAVHERTVYNMCYINLYYIEYYCLTLITNVFIGLIL